MSNGDPTNNLILCNVNGNTIVTTPQHCQQIGGTPDEGDEPDDSDLITCRLDGIEILTRPQDCDILGGQIV